MKKIAARLRAKLSARLARTPLWVSFMLMTSLLLLTSTLLLSLFNYNYSRSGSIREYNTQSERLLNLKAQNLKSYLDSLSEFCVLPVTDNAFYQQLHQTVPLSEAAQQDILQKIQTYYYTRTDLNAYHLYLLNQDLVIGRSSGDQRMKLQSAPNMGGNRQLEMCLKAKSGASISPASDGSLFVFSHTIIRISDKSPLAAAVIEVTPSALLSGMEGTNITLYSGGIPFWPADLSRRMVWSGSGTNSTFTAPHRTKPMGSGSSRSSLFLQLRKAFVVPGPSPCWRAFCF